jgi:hypothetical protein
MLNLIVGNVDSGAALVLVVIFAGATMITTSIIIKRRSVLEINNEFELGKMKEADAHALNLAQNARAEKVALAEMAMKREIEFKRIDGNAIEHTVEDVRKG